MTVNQSRIPVHVLTGFLGSGKTTLLSGLLLQPALQDTLVIVNEIGEIGFDHLLLSETREEIIVELEGGCLCCEVRGDLVRTLTKAHQHLTQNRGERFARVVIETSGLATPGAIVRTVMLNDKLAPLYSLGRIAAAFDMVHGPKTLTGFAEAQAQIAAAETVVLTKLDLLDEALHAQALADLRSCNPGAALCSGQAFLDRTGGWLDEIDELELSKRGDTGHALQHELESFPHTQNIHTFTLRCAQPVERRAFNEWMSVRLRFLEGQVLRVKGLVRLIDGERPVFVHGVQQMFHPPRALDEWPTTARETRLVFVTEGIAKEVIESSFEEHVQPGCSGLSETRAQSGVRVSRH